MKQKQKAFPLMVLQMQLVEKRVYPLAVRKIQRMIRVALKQRTNHMIMTLNELGLWVAQLVQLMAQE